MFRSILARSLLAFSAALFLMLAVPNAARAADDYPPDDPTPGDDTSVPEFDLATAGAAFALLTGGAMVLSSRRKQRNPAAG